jgi:alkylated DNA repair dioxygenase AlkB
MTPATGRWTSEYYEDFVSVPEAQVLLEFLVGLPYRQERYRGQLIKRRQCDFGATYSPGGKLTPAGPIPSELAWIQRRVEERCAAVFDQIIVTWYSPGAGIGRHADDLWFGEPIAGLSLHSDCVLRGLGAIECGGSDSVAQSLAARSLYVIRGAERSDWKHEIPGRSVRADRWSLTFRVLTPESYAAIEADAPQRK